jgi:hypothetical protein
VLAGVPRLDLVHRGEVRAGGHRQPEADLPDARVGDLQALLEPACRRAATAVEDDGRVGRRLAEAAQDRPELRTVRASEAAGHGGQDDALGGGGEV